MQDREIMRVLVECCLQEKAFNKYYCALASKLCSHDKNNKFTLQVCLLLKCILGSCVTRSFVLRKVGGQKVHLLHSLISRKGEITSRVYLV